MITIKIRDSRWFKKHCKIISSCGELVPKYFPWDKKVFALAWNGEGSSMSLLRGKVLEIERDDGNKAGDITDARYFAGGFWIPNWAIEWVKEVLN